MAYIDTSEPFLPAYRAPVAQATGLTFDRREWEVIALARRDGLGSLREPSRLSAWMAQLIGARPSRRLANARLEALRRFAVLAWHYGYGLPVSAMKAFKEAGYSLDHIELLLASVAAGRSRRSVAAAA